jgi:hydrogenase-4 component B
MDRRRDRETVLAYSSLSQMGLMTVAVGAGFAAGRATAAAGAATAFALHHALAKSALFLGVGVVERAVARRWRPLVLAGLLVPVASLAGLPLTSGAIAKQALANAIERVGWAAAPPLLSLSSVGTLLLLLHYLRVLRARAGSRHEAPAPSMWMAWALATIATAGLPWVVPWGTLPAAARETLSWAKAASGSWPAGLAALMAALVVLARRRGCPLRAPHVPPGDLAEWLSRAVAAARRAATALERRLARAAGRLEARVASLVRAAARAGREAARLEAHLASWTAGSLLFAILAAVLLWVLRG